MFFLIKINKLTERMIKKINNYGVPTLIEELHKINKR